MKKKVIMICLLMTLITVGCGKKQITSEGSIIEQEISNSDKNNELSQIESSESKTDNTENTSENSQNVEENFKQIAVVYYVDDNDTVQKKEMELDVLNEQTLWQLLKEDGTVVQDSNVISMSMNSKFQIDLDVNHAFGEQLRSLGTDGEYHLVQCVTNSYLETFSNKEIKITEEGNTLESGHVSYKGYSGIISD